MSRSVETVGNNVVYFDAGEYLEDDWEDLIANLKCEISNSFPSFCYVYKWVSYPYRENQIILENDLVSISISEYCGCGAISVFLKRECERIELADHWLCQNFPKIEQIILQYVTGLRKLGTFSNGESVYERI